MTFGKRTGAVLAAILLAAATGCSTKAPGGGGDTGGGGGGVKTGPGVQGNTITLGVLTDLTGVFAALGNDITNAHTLYWDKKNAAGGVCGKYQVKLNVKDTGYVPQTGVQLYSGMKNDVLAMQQTIGSPINTALEQQYINDKMVNLPSAWARNLTKPPGNGVVGATYDLEMTNALNYALKEGLIKEGDTIGHIYFTGEYGENGLAGSEYMAEKHNLKLQKAEIKSTDQDMSAQVTQFKAAGVKAIVLTVAPGQTASVAGVSKAQGLDVPIIGSNPVFAPGLLNGPAGEELKKRLYISSPTNTFEGQEQLLNDYKQKYNVASPSLGVVFGTAMSEVMSQILDKACQNGDLTRDGVLKAKQSLSNLETGNLVVPLDFSVPPGESPSKQNFILQPADLPGGVKALTKEPFEGEDVADFKPAG